MRPARTLLVAALACLALGAFVDSVRAVIADPGVERVALDLPETLIVPLGHIGDEVTYAVYDRWDESCRGRFGTPAFTDYYQDDDPLRLSGAQTFRVGAAEEIRGATNDRHLVVPVEWRGSLDGNTDEPSIFPSPITYFSAFGQLEERQGGAPTEDHEDFDCAPRHTPDGGSLDPDELDASAAQESPRRFEHYWGEFHDDHLREQFVDLGTRSVVRQDDMPSAAANAGSMCLATPVGADYEGECTSLPNAADTSSTFPVVDPDLLGLKYQGRTLTLGQELFAPTDIPEWNGWRVGPSQLLRHMGWRDDGESVDQSYRHYSPEVDRITYHEWVAEQGRVNDRDALGVHIEVQVHYRMPASGGQPAGEWHTWRSLTKAWVTAEAPYPVLVQGNRFDRSLSSFEPGTVLIPWTGAAAVPDPLLAPGALERSPANAQFPSDGVVSPFAYPLRDAVADVTATNPSDLGDLDGSPVLPAFAAWLDAHPGARLAAARYHDAASTTWRLVYAVSSGEAFEVLAKLEDGQKTVQSIGEVRVPSFSATEFPPSPIAFAAAASVWRAQSAIVNPNDPVSFALWGFDAWNADEYGNPACLRTPSDQVDWRQGTWMRHREPFREAVIGDMHGDHCQWAGVSVETGRPAELRDEAGLDSPTHAGDARAPQFGDLSVAGRTPPSILTGATVAGTAVAGGSLFVAFATVYLAPTLKFTGAKILLLVPGYTKLQKNQLLDNRVRDELLQAIQTDPGVAATDLGKKVDAGWGTVVYHLSVLEKNKMISSLVDGRHRRFFPVGTVDWSRRGQIAVLKNERTKSLYEMIAGEPGVIQEALAGRTGVSRPATIWHLRRLEDCGLVGRVREGRKVHYFVNESPPDVHEYDAKDAVEVA